MFITNVIRNKRNEIQYLNKTQKADMIAMEKNKIEMGR